MFNFVKIATFIFKNPKNLNFAGLAQLVEHLPCKQRVGGSSPLASSITLSIQNAVLGPIFSVFG